MQGNWVTIVKDGQITITEENNLSKGDVVFLQAGDYVPADIKLIETTGLETDEFDVTGELLPVIKKVNDQEDTLYMGSRITKGTGRGIVLATGEQTEYGQVLKQVWEHDKPQTYTLNIFHKSSVGIIGLLLLGATILLAQGINIYAWMTVFPVVFFILVIFQNREFFRQRIFSVEQNRLEQTNIKIRDIKALEDMNKINLICFDKTGVLTTRHMDVKNIYYVDGISVSQNLTTEENPSRLVNLACALCNEVIYLEKIDLADSIDKAIITFSQKNGINLVELHTHYQRIYDQPFDSENRFMATGFKKGDEVFHFIKGDPAVILNNCTHYMTSTGVVQKVNFTYYTNNSSNIAAITQNGDTVIALAYSSQVSEYPPEDWTFLCLLQLQNSLQPGVREMIRELSGEKIRSIMLTGDRAETAGRVAVDCGITNDPRICLTGRTIQTMAWSEIARQSAYCSVFARLLPSHKAALIRIFQQAGHYTAMIGDGPNDGIALKAADIGISFSKDSSPFARKLSKIIINNLSDVKIILEASDRVNRCLSNFETIRLLTIAGILLGLYGSILVIYLTTK